MGRRPYKLKGDYNMRHEAEKLYGKKNFPYTADQYAKLIKYLIAKEKKHGVPQ